MRNFLLFVTALIISAGLTIPTIAQDLPEYSAHIYRHNGARLPYRMLRPPGSSQPYPLLVFLHGSYEKGIDNNRQLDLGGKFFATDSIRASFPAIVIFPQCPYNDAWTYFTTNIDSSTGLAKDWYFPFRDRPTVTAGIVKELIDSLVMTGEIDSNRIYIGGLSQGGMGVLDMIARYQGMFAGAFAICGAGATRTATRIAGNTALWLFHGDADRIVPVSFSRTYFRKLKRLGAVVRYSEYPDVGHDSWYNAFAEHDLLPWLFAQKKHLTKLF